ncbi:hypothetical protein ACFQPG_06645 [Sphingomonas sp. GCM10030256]|uniref:hypothetical protein n=1 Tax=Sphingomonas sp. GCM10030256 TaxID=3273427 RepID=UPI0036150BFE
MTYMHVAVTFSLVAASPVAAAETQSAGAPVAEPGARYCMRVEPPTGSRIERVLCWTRQEWADQGVNVDKDWVREGVSILQPRPARI